MNPKPLNEFARRSESHLRLTTHWSLSVLIAFAALFGSRPAAAQGDVPQRFRGALLTAAMATDESLQELSNSGYTTTVLMLGSVDEEAATADREAAKRIASAGLSLGYWIEIARRPELADASPLLMASLQGHEEWRRWHPDFPQPDEDEVVKVFPWVPLFYHEAFNAHLSRVEQLLSDRPPAEAVFLNDLQGAPSACGCGNPVCRWTTDYGPIVTAERLGNDAPAKFVAAVKGLVPERTRVIPVWTTECEDHDGAKAGLCAGVSCYEGRCWKVYSQQLNPLAAEVEMIGALLLYKEFLQDGPSDTAPAGWVGHALTHGFAEQPSKHGAKPIDASRLISVLQGWDVSDDELKAQIDLAIAVGVTGYLVALARIDQSWQPRLVKSN